VGLVLVVYCGLIFLRSRRDKINANNVNDQWGQHAEDFEKVATPEVEVPKSELVGV
jgi:hypothetical protein